MQSDLAMKFQFSIQQYQTDAVNAVIDVFAGQGLHSSISYTQDFGELGITSLGEKNAQVTITDKQLLENLRVVQRRNEIKLSSDLVKSELGACVLDVEMETGTGKTYVYIKTMFELNKRFGWNKFIVIVPSVAIREGVAKSFQVLQDHFMDQYGKKARYFVYNSKQLRDIASFADSSALSVMIINMQAFAASLKPDGTQKDAKTINSERDEFESRRPIDVIADTRPILILDESQKLEGDATQTGMKRFKPLFVINYSATHKTEHNLVYALDPIDAFRQRLVKRIEVKGFEVKNILGVNCFITLEQIQSTKENTFAYVRHDIRRTGSIGQKRSRLRVGDSLYALSNELPEYQNFVVNDIDASRNRITFTNGIELTAGEVIGDQTRDVIQRVQIAETIRSHLEKEKILFRKGIKTLSLFFIDEVANYRSYDRVGNPQKAKFERWFEEEYESAVDSILLDLNLDLPWDAKYAAYLKRFSPEEVHRGYFSQDKNHHFIDSKIKKGDGSDDKDAYDLILKDKERLLSFNEPTRFIFSHSALQEGWDNPNIFQICTLRNTHSAIKKRQEVGRGLRLCVDETGHRQDVNLLGERVHEINLLTVVANENYSEFVKALQNETKVVLRDRPTTVTEEFFVGKTLVLGATEHTLTQTEAKQLLTYLRFYQYIDGNGSLTEKYKQDQENHKLEEFQPNEELNALRPFAATIHKLLNSIYDTNVSFQDIVIDGSAPIAVNQVNRKNMECAEFKALWEKICPKFSYTVSYDSQELIENAIRAINENLSVSHLVYQTITGRQREADEFEKIKTQIGQEFFISLSSRVKYDLVGEIAKGANITRKSAAKILGGIEPNKFSLYAANPEEFIAKVKTIIRETKATMIVEHIRYHATSNTYDTTIFTMEKSKIPASSLPAKKHVMDYVVTDGQVETSFAKELEAAVEVVVYAKLPRTFHIPTPVGNYAPDWAIAFRRGEIKHVFFVAETKGSMDTMQLRDIEKAKIECAKKLFNEVKAAGNVRYHQVTTYRDLLDEVRRLDAFEV